MPTRQDYAARLLPLLTEGLGPHLLSAAPGEVFSIAELADTLGGILEELERQHLGASSHIRALMAEQPTEPWDGHGGLAFLLYYLHNPPPELRAEIDALPELKVVWDAMAAAAAPSPFTPGSFGALAASLPTQALVKCNEWGDIYGTGKYEQLDDGWAWTLKNDAMNHLPKWAGNGYGIADFVKHDWKQPLSLQPGSDGQVRIAIIGDWGSGEYTLSGLANKRGPAFAVMDTLGKLTPPPDYLIHLGDTYYSGTDANRSPVREEADHLIAALKQYPSLAKPGHCFALNSNHEMYGGAYGYFGTALAHPLFSGQKGCSYFALAFGNWIIAGIDSAYFDPSNLYMAGGLGDKTLDPQYAFLKQLKTSGKKLILLSHHTGLSTDGASPSDYLWNDVTSVVAPDYWYWGHTHLGAAYSSKAHSGNMRTRCIGHSSMPFAIPPGMEKCQQNVDWYSATPLDPSTALQAPYYSRPRAKNGFAMLTLGKDAISEQAYDIGNTTPVWSRVCNETGGS
jgi:hypothetical protein